MLPVTIWMNMPSFHQADLFRALTDSGKISLQVIFAQDLSQDRIQLGWQNDLAGYRYRFLKAHHQSIDAVRLAWSQRDRLHVFGGIWAVPSFSLALTLLSLARGTYAIYSEAPEPSLPTSGKKKLARSFGKIVARRAAGIFFISHLSKNFFGQLGVGEHLMYPFGYFRSIPKLVGDMAYVRRGNRIEMIFIGQIIHRKGLDLLIQATAPFFEKHPNLVLTIIGGGEMLETLKERVANLGLTERIMFEDVLPYDKVPARLASADVMVLPSRWDGWGMVVNEALSVGIPVIASDRCGASDLICHGSNGYVFRSEDVADLRACLSSFLNKKMEWERFRNRAAATGDRISITEITPYFIRCLQHMAGELDARPSPPWI